MVQALTNEGMAVVWSTAYLDEAERCDTVLLLNEGELAFDGPPHDLTRGLEGRSFRLEDVGDERRAVLGGQRARCDGHAAEGVRFRAEPVPAHEHAPAYLRRPVQSQPRRHLQDRKSTRLNSSH